MMTATNTRKEARESLTGKWGKAEEILVDHEDTCIRIPMIGDIRSLNLSNSVAIVAYEALRQHGFESMSLLNIFLYNIVLVATTSNTILIYEYIHFRESIVY